MRLLLARQFSMSVSLTGQLCGRGWLTFGDLLLRPPALETNSGYRTQIHNPDSLVVVVVSLPSRSRHFLWRGRGGANNNNPKNPGLEPEFSPDSNPGSKPGLNPGLNPGLKPRFKTQVLIQVRNPGSKIQGLNTEFPGSLIQEG